MMKPMTFLCDAIYRGSQIVEGAVSPSMLTSLAEVVLSADQAIRGYAEICIDKLPRGERCQLQIDEERLRVSSSRKDEGFESDSESSSMTSGSSIEEALCGSPEIKVIKDHVLRLEKLIRQDSGIHHCTSKIPEDGGTPSLSSSSGAESEEESPKRLQNKMDPNVLLPNCSNDVTTSALLTKSENKVENGPGDNFLMSDILFCHVMSHRPKVVIVVVKSVDSNLVVAHLFECLSQEAARTLYNCYYTASNKYKLNRYRINKRRNEQIGADDKAVLDRIHVSIRNIRRKSLEPFSVNNAVNNETTRQSRMFNDQLMAKSENLNVNVIEIRNPDINLNGMMQRIDEHGVTHIEIESAPCSIVPPSLEAHNQSKVSFENPDILSALDRLSIHSSNNPDSYLNYVGVTSSCPNSLIATSREIMAGGEKERKSRQRQPPLLLKKEASRNLDSLSTKEIRKKPERRNRSRSEEKKKSDEAKLSIFSESQRSRNEDFFHQTTDSSLTMSKQNAKEAIINQRKETRPIYEAEVRSPERQSRLRSNLKSKETSRCRSSHNKGPAPPPPPRRHPNNPSLMLVPTKSGQENTRAYYPKESHIVRGSSKIVRIDYPVYPPWNMNSDINNNPQMIYYARPGWLSSHEYHTNRGTESSISADLRKRSRSKSPARRPMAHRYMDVVSTFSLSQKLKDLSDTVMQSWKNSVPTSNTSYPFNVLKEGQTRASGRREKMSQAFSVPSLTKCDDPLRPVIKRNRKGDNGSDARRVTFSAYATVQVMDS